MRTDSAEWKPRRAAGAEERQCAHEVAAWAIAAGRPLSPRALDVVTAAKLARPEPFTRWTEQTVNELLWAGILTWCQEQDVECPARVAETMWSYLTFLYEHRAFAEGSDPIQRLREPLLAVGGLTRDGRERIRSRRHPSEQVRPARPSARLAPVIPLRRAARA